VIGGVGAIAVRATLISALSDIAAERRNSVVRFLQGLSSDELQYLAEFFGACTLEASGRTGELAERIAAFARAKRPCRRSHAWLADQDHKMILLHEYLGRSGLNAVPRTMHGGWHAV
jgi:hypothetical protein